MFIFELRKAFPLRADQLSTTLQRPGRVDRGDRGAQRRRRPAARRARPRAPASATYPFGLPGLPRRRRPPSAAAIDARGRRAARPPRRRRRPGARRGRAPGRAGQLRPRGRNARRVHDRPPPARARGGAHAGDRRNAHAPRRAAPRRRRPLPAPGRDAARARRAGGRRLARHVAARPRERRLPCGVEGPGDRDRRGRARHARPARAAARSTCWTLVHTEDQAGDDRARRPRPAARGGGPDAAAGRGDRDPVHGARTPASGASSRSRRSSPTCARCWRARGRCAPATSRSRTRRRRTSRRAHGSTRRGSRRSSRSPTASSPSLDAYLATLDPLLADQPARRQDVLDGIDDFVDDAASLLARAAGFGLPQSGWGFALDVAARPVRRARQAAARARRAVGRAAGRVRPDPPGGARAAGRHAGRGAVPAAPAGGDRRVDDARPAAGERARPAHARRGQGRGARGAPRRARRSSPTPRDPRLSRLLAGVAALLPLTAFDSEPFDVTLDEDAVVGFAITLSAVVTGRRDDLRRADRDRPGAARRPRRRRRRRRRGSRRCSRPAGRCSARTSLLVPEFTLPADQGDALEAALAGDRASCSQHLEDDTEIEFPVDEWLYGVARVRAPMRTSSRPRCSPGVGHPELVPAQLPHVAGERWLALDYPPDQTIDSERLLYTARYDDRVRQGGAAVRPAARRVDRGRSPARRRTPASRSTTTAQQRGAAGAAAGHARRPGTAPGSGTTSSAR